MREHLTLVRQLRTDEIGHEHRHELDDLLVPVDPSDTDVMESASVPERDGSVRVDPVEAHPRHFRQIALRMRLGARWVALRCDRRRKRRSGPGAVRPPMRPPALPGGGAWLIDKVCARDEVHSPATGDVSCCSGNTHLTRSRVRCGFKCGREAQSKGSKLASTIAQDKLIFDRVLASLVIERDRLVADFAHAV